MLPYITIFPASLCPMVLKFISDLIKAVKQGEQKWKKKYLDYQAELEQR
jgi:hypothetical protein